MLHRRSSLVAAILSACMALLAPLTSRAARSPAAEAEALYRSALARLEVPRLDARRQAVVELERATLLEPSRAELFRELGRACLDAGYPTRARQALLHATAIAPGDHQSQSLLARAWIWDWLSSFERVSLDHAIAAYARAAEAAPESSHAWTALAALEIARGEPRAALASAVRARAADPEAPEPILMLGSALARLGATEAADTLFRAGVARLAGADRARFEGMSVLESPPGSLGELLFASDSLVLSAPGGTTDPDLTTPANEAEVDYRTRVALALALFREGGRAVWDRRADLFVRYGPPAEVELNPASQPGEFYYPHRMNDEIIPPPLGFPIVTQVWRYPDLGMSVALWDRSLTRHFEFPVTLEAEADPRPSLAALGSRSDLVALGDRRGVFRVAPPGARPLEMSGGFSRFPIDGGARLVAHLAAPGGREDSLVGSWAVMRSDGRIVARGSRPLAPSACDATGLQVADFAIEAIAGDYRVDLAVRGTRGRRRVLHFQQALASAPPGLCLSDLVLLCGDQASAVVPEGIRLEANLGRRVPRRSLITVYCELSHLKLDAGSRARFSYRYALAPIGAAGRGAAGAEPVLEATREETNLGSTRRQFVEIPIRPLAPGAYRLSLEVRDLASGERASRTADFVLDARADGEARDATPARQP